MTLPTYEDLERIKISAEDKALVGHFINNPLSVILGDAAYIAEVRHQLSHPDPAVTEDVRDAAVNIVGAAQELAKVIRLLGAARPVDDEQGEGEGTGLEPGPTVHGG